MENNNRVESASSGIDGAPSAGQIVFDTSSGFSVEEQQEILNKINSLNVEKSIAPREGMLQSEAKKRGFLFPLLVNIAAVLLLAAGFFLLRSFHGRDDQDIREGQTVLDVAERQLIQEIRRETDSRLNEKERQISEIHSRLTAAGDEYRELQVSVENLTEEQKERAQYLLDMREEYQSTLSTLEDERTKILEDSRAREAGLRAQAEERARELSSRIERSETSLNEAARELARLSGEQDRAAAAEAQLGGYYTALDGQIDAGQNDEALRTISSMREFLESAAFPARGAGESRRQNQLAAAAALEKVLAAIKAHGITAAPDLSAETAAAGAVLAERIAALEQTAREQEAAVADLTSQISERDTRIADYEISVAGLEETAAARQRTISERDAELQTAAAEIAAKGQQVNDLSDALMASQEEVTALEGANERQNQRISELETGLRAIEQILQNQ